MLTGRNAVSERLEIELDGNRAVGFGNRGILRYCCTLLHRDKRLPNADAPTTFQYRPPLVTLERQQRFAVMSNFLSPIGCSWLLNGPPVDNLRRWLSEP